MTTAQASEHIKPSDELRGVEQGKQRLINRKLREESWKQADAEACVACDAWVRKTHGMLAGFVRLDEENLPAWQPTNDWGGDVFMFRTQGGAARSMDSDYSTKMPLDHTIVPAVLLFNPANISGDDQRYDGVATGQTPHEPPTVVGDFAQDANLVYRLMRLQADMHRWMKTLGAIADSDDGSKACESAGRVSEGVYYLMQNTQEIISELLGGWQSWESEALKQEESARRNAQVNVHLGEVS